MTALADAERRDRLRLSRTPRIGPVTLQQLIARHRSAARAIEALPEIARRAGAPPPRVPTREEAEREIAAGGALGARLVAAGEPDFPPLLGALDPPPPLIWVRGRSELLSQTSVGLVGARIASAAGQRFARGLAADLGRAGIVVVSGMARGIDGAAHDGALSTGTVAVLAGGVDDIYPAEHAALYERICAEGCVVSESAIGWRATARDFPRRNRLISGLSQAVVVVEAELRSGSLITARLANEQGREVLAVPGSPLDPRAKGPNDLIRQGAALCEGVEDVLKALQSPFRQPPARDLFSPDGAQEDLSDSEMDSLRDRLEALLSPTPVHRDDLVRSLGRSAGAVGGALAELAILGRAELLPGGMVVRG